MIYESLGGDSDEQARESPITDIVNRIIDFDRKLGFHTPAHRKNSDEFPDDRSFRSVNSVSPKYSNLKHLQDFEIPMIKKKRGPKPKKFKNNLNDTKISQNGTTASDKMLMLNKTQNHFGILFSLIGSVKEREEVKYANFRIADELFWKKVDKTQDKNRNDDNYYLGKRSVMSDKIPHKKHEKPTKVEKLFNVKTRNGYKSSLDKENIMIKSFTPSPTKRLKLESNGINHLRKHKSEISRLLEDYNPQTLKLYEKLKDTNSITLRSRKSNNN